MRNWGILTEIAKRHRVTVVAFDRCRGTGEGEAGDDGVDNGLDNGDGRWEARDRIEALGAVLITAPAPPPRPIARRLADLPGTRDPDLARRLDAPALSDVIVDHLAEVRADPYDVLQIEGLEMARHGWHALAFAPLALDGRRPRLIYDAHNAEWVLQDRAWRADARRLAGWPAALYSRLQTVKLRRFEARLLAAADATVAVSAADAAALQPLAPTARLTVVPNGIDTDAYAPTGAPEDDDLCVFTGKMDFRPNVDGVAWFVHDVWGRVRDARPTARLRIVGRDPSPRVMALDDAATGIAVTGAVPDVRPHLAAAGVVVVPLRVGGGTRLKVLEAMAMGKAVAATSLAVEGLDLVPGREVLVADTAADLAAAVLRLAADPAERRALGAAARARVVRDYRWATLVPGIEALYGS